MFKRKTKPCPDLFRTPEELLAYARIPDCERTHRIQKHKTPTVNAYVNHLFNVLSYLGPSRWALPWNPAHVLAFFKDFYENQGESIPKTIAHLSAINSYHVTHSCPSVYSYDLSTYINELRAAHTRIKAIPVTTDQVCAMVDVARMGRPMVGIRDSAILLTSYAHGFRPSQLTGFKRPHITMHEQGMRITVGPHKGAPGGERPRTLTIARASSARYCPVAAMEKWLEQDFGEHVFVRLGRNDREYQPLDSSDICQIVHEYGLAIGAQGKFTAYSLRRGFATNLKAAGVPLEQIQDGLLHLNSYTSRIYIDDVPVPFSRSLSRLVLP